ncbi:hypothetical protein [Dryocola clanedunensis]|uniref:hypothetical protein n=1 Tax=Cedecea sulfonylureivorans TaxID=3051154 RepID=UPI001F451134|nr:hypothetical protein [Cedecea sulfonylureivorans]
MTKKTQLMAGGVLVNGAEYIDSQELLVLVNDARRECGQKPIRNNDFVARIKDELVGEGYETFVTPLDLKKGGAAQEVIGMNGKQALRVAARESKAVRRVLVDKLEARSNPAPVHRELSTLEILQIAMESEQGRLAEKSRADEAERTKAEIGSRREATAMATASAAVRKSNQLAERLGEHEKHATVKAVKKITDTEYPWRPLKKWCVENGLEPHQVPDNQFGFVRSWPREAWLAVHGVDLTALYGGEYA